ncbi:NAD(P)-binding protein, partial [Exidia glandulosa HHB12029]
AGGPFGTAMLDELLKCGWHVVILARTPSAIPLRPNSTVVQLDLGNHSALVEAMRGAQVVMCSVSGRARTGVDSFEMQKPLIDAAISAGVRRYIPSEWATDHDHPAAQALPDLVYGSRRKVMRYLKEKAASGEIEYTLFFSGVLFDWALRNGWFGFDISKRHARIVNSGDLRRVVSSNAACAHATARALSLEHFDATANRSLRTVGGFISQNEVLAVLERLTGDKFTIEHISSEECGRRGRAVLQRGEFTVEAVRDLIISSAYSKSGPFNWGLEDNEWLGIKTEDLHAVIENVVSTT